MKNTITSELQLTQTKITFCYGKKAYRKHIKKEHSLDIKLENSGVTQPLIKSNGSFTVAIGVKEREDVYILKAIIVHEISHAVTEWMDYYGFKCDETRSYTIQFLYMEFMQFLDEILSRRKMGA